MRAVPLLFVLLLLVGCGGSGGAVDSNTKTSDAQATVAEEDPEDLSTMTGIELYLYDTRPTEGAPRKPLVTIRAEKSSLEAGQVWSLEGAHAVIRGTGGEESAIFLDAASGRFEEGKRAYLRGGVTARVGETSIELEDIEVTNLEDNNLGIAFSENPVTMKAPRFSLEASAMRLYPDTREFEIEEVQGMFRFPEDLE